LKASRKEKKVGSDSATGVGLASDKVIVGLLRKAKRSLSFH